MLGRDAGGAGAWCEACQLGWRLAPGEATRCPNCGGEPSIDRPRFIEALNELQNLDAVLTAWSGDPAPIAALLPERPRWITDLTPPEARPSDLAELSEAIVALRSGAWSRALEILLDAGPKLSSEARAWEARAIAEERLGRLAEAEASWSRRLERSEDPRARLMRGTLRARRGDLEAAHEDLAHAGTGREARWNRAALRISESVAITPGLPLSETIAAARAEAGPASEYWSDHTVGRLLWSLLVERALWRARRDASTCPDARVLRAAESELEHDTFWDRALLLHGYAALGLASEAAAIAAPLARQRVESLASEPWLGARGAEPIRAGVEMARTAILAGDPPRAHAAVTPLLGRADLRSYGVPCAHCGRGTMRAEPAE